MKLKRKFGSSLDHNTALLFIMLIAFVLRFIIFLLFEPWDSQVETNSILKLDALGYHNLALCILEEGSFCNNTFRTPIYPLFVAFIYFIFGAKPWIVLFIQIFINILSLFLVYLLAKELFTRKIGLIAAALIAIDPHQILYSSTFLLTDVLFITIFLLSILLFVKFLKTERTQYVIISAFLIGLATLVRPISMYFILGIAGLLLIYFPMKWNKRLKVLTIYILVFFVTIFPWCYRNYVQFNNFSLTTITGHNLLFYNVTFTEVANTGKDPETVRKEFRKEAEKRGFYPNNNPFDNDKINQEIAKEYIKKNMVVYSIRHIKGIINMYINLATKNIVERLGFSESQELNFDFFASPGIFKAALNFFHSKSTPEIIVGAFLILFLSFCYLTALVGIGLLIKEKNYFYLILILGIILYFSLITGVVGIARYKLPISTFYLILSAYGINKIRRRSRIGS